VDVPVQFFQSTIAIELAVAGALLWEIRYFDRERGAGRDRREVVAVVGLFMYVLVVGGVIA
jgi:hypothetical protein